MIPRTACLVLTLLCACQATSTVEPVVLQETAAPSSIEIITLENASARELAGTLSGLLRAASSGGAGPKMTVMADQRTNSLLILAPPAEMARLRDLIALLDVEVDSGG
jgi:general secretion pathway protein D